MDTIAKKEFVFINRILILTFLLISGMGIMLGLLHNKVSNLEDQISPDVSNILDIDVLYKADSVYFEYIDLCYEITKINRDITTQANIALLTISKKKRDYLIKKRSKIYSQYRKYYNKLDSHFKNEFYLPQPY